MSIMNYIRKQKEGFQYFKHSRALQREKAILEEAKLQRIRAAELARAKQERVRAQTDTQRIEEFNARHTKPSKLQSFGQGLARVMNEQKARSAKRSFAKSRPASGRRAGGTLSRINEGSRGVEFGGSGSGGSSPFSTPSRPLDYGRPAPVAKKETPRKVIVTLR